MIKVPYCQASIITILRTIRYYCQLTLFMSGPYQSNPFDRIDKEPVKSNAYNPYEQYNLDDSVNASAYQGEADNNTAAHNTPKLDYALQRPYADQLMKQILIAQQQPPKTLYARTRQNFVFKVYAILSAQILVTVGMCLASYYSWTFLVFQVSTIWLQWTLFGIMIATQIAIFCSPISRKHPYNLIALLLFTLCQAYFVSYFCAIVAMESGNHIVLVAALMTLGMVIVLTIFAVTQPVNYNALIGVLVGCVFSLLFFGIFCWIDWCPILINLYCSLGVMLFSIYLIIDTKLIFGNNRGLQLSADDYIVGALILYIDIIQMFLYVLMLLGKK